MSVVLSEEQSKLIDEIVAKEGINKYDIDVSSGSTKGDNYMGIITTVKVSDKNSDKILNLIVKSAHPSPEFRIQSPVAAAYLREIFIYETIFPETEKFQTERNVTNKFTEHAKCFGCIKKEPDECLVLENLREIGYGLWDRTKPMNGDHVALVLKTYGKWHGASLAMKHLENAKFEELTKNLTNIFERYAEDSIIDMMVNSVLVKGYKAVEDETVLAAFMKFGAGIPDFMKNELQQPNDGWVVTHGDCWCNNMMFKYEDPSNPSKPTNVRLLDWQISKKSCLVDDLAYFFYACSSKEVLYDYKKYLQIYYDSLSTTIREHGADPEKIYTYETLLSHWKNYTKFGIYLALMVINVMLLETTEAPDFAKSAQEGKSMIDQISSLTADGINKDLYNERINDLVVFLYENDLL